MHVGFCAAFHIRIYKLCVFILQPELPNGKVRGVSHHAFFVVTSSPNAQDGYSKSGQMDWLIHREEGNVIPLDDKPLNELMACDRRREEWERIDNLWMTGRERRTLEIETEGKNAWPGMNKIALSTFICLQAFIIHVHIQTVCNNNNNSNIHNNLVWKITQPNIISVMFNELFLCARFRFKKDSWIFMICELYKLPCHILTIVDGWSYIIINAYNQENEILSRIYCVVY